MSDFLIFFVAFFLCLISVISYGKIFERLFLRNIFFNDNISVYTGFYGLTFLTLISLLTSYFVPHNFYHNIAIHSIGLFYFLINVFKKDKKYLKYIFLISLFTISALIISKTNDDLSYYHLPFTKYITEHKIIFGMGHLNHGYNLLSSIFYLNSIFYLPFIQLYSFHFSLLFFLIFFNYFLIKEIVLNKNDLITKYLYFFTFAYFNLSFNRLAEFGTDKGGQLLIVILIIKLFDLICFNTKSKKLENIILLIPLFGFSITLKTYFLPYSLLVLTIFMLDGNFLKNFRLIIFSKATLSSLLIIVLMFSHHFISTGCIVSPLPFTCFGENVIWGKDIEIMKGLSVWLEQWAKAGAGPNFRAENLELYVQNFNWVSNWIRMYFIGKFSDQLGIFITCCIVITLIFKRLDINKRFKIKNKNKIFIFYIILLVIFMIWFTNHPTLRYGGYSIVFLVLAIPISLLISKLIERDYFDKKFKFFIVFVIIVFNFKNLDRIKNEFDRNDIFKFSNFPYYAVTTMKYKETKFKEGLSIYSAEGHCWSTPTPCGGVSDNLNVHKIKSYYFIEVNN